MEYFIVIYLVDGSIHKFNCDEETYNAHYKTWCNFRMVQVQESPKKIIEINKNHIIKISIDGGE